MSLADRRRASGAGGKTRLDCVTGNTKVPVLWRKEVVIEVVITGVRSKVGGQRLLRPAAPGTWEVALKPNPLGASTSH